MSNSLAFFLTTVFLSVPNKLPGLGGGTCQLAGSPKEKTSTPIFCHLVSLCFYLNSYLATMGYLPLERSYFGS